ncbi:protein PHLOEM PROTEIN 2-LIKE A1-like [Durio zibethinus]|uniref:Protein PHLOEM PROTEIN 2-LIKE A1-like n=1 Tax=Durio zibethinus TaxID=66656 RepID=A0A6P5WWC8_DURZI|nr:protein PHLOEM PROTEIN 2-LIKE A1-like [Durio zibethinus]
MDLKRKAGATDTNEVFPQHKMKKAWEDAKSGHKCFVLYARSLHIIWSDHEYWMWESFKETSDEKIEVARLRTVCWLEVKGKFKILDLSPGTVYEVVYVVMLTKEASGWELPVKLKLSLPDGKVQERQVSLLQKPRGQWMELGLGHFCTGENGETGEVCFDLYEIGGHWKSGLVIKGAILRPIN